MSEKVMLTAQDCEELYEETKRFGNGEHFVHRLGESARRLAAILREREQNAGEAVGRVRVQTEGNLTRVYGELDAWFQIEANDGDLLYTHPAQAASVPSDDAIRAFLHESEGLLIASEDELLPLIREAVVALASAPTAQAVSVPLDCPKEPGAYWYQRDEGGHLQLHDVFTRPGHSYLCVYGQPYGVGKHEYLMVAKMPGKWWRIAAPTAPAQPVSVPDGWRELWQEVRGAVDDCPFDDESLDEARHHLDKLHDLLASAPAGDGVSHD